MKKRAYIRYTKSGKIIPGGLLITTEGIYPHDTAVYQEIPVNLCCGAFPDVISGRKKAWVKYDSAGEIVPGSLTITLKHPKPGVWKEVNTDLCCTPVSEIRLTTFYGNETGGYPVGVFSSSDPDGNYYIGIANNEVEYAAMWNADEGNNIAYPGVIISPTSDPLLFRLNTSDTPKLIALRYFQFETNANTTVYTYGSATYSRVDWGDGSPILPPSLQAGVTVTGNVYTNYSSFGQAVSVGVTSNFVYETVVANRFNKTLTGSKTIRVFHNEVEPNTGVADGYILGGWLNTPPKIQNLTGNFPKFTMSIDITSTNPVASNFKLSHISNYAELTNTRIVVMGSGTLNANWGGFTSVYDVDLSYMTELEAISTIGGWTRSFDPLNLTKARFPKLQTYWASWPVWYYGGGSTSAEYNTMPTVTDNFRYISMTNEISNTTAIVDKRFIDLDTAMSAVTVVTPSTGKPCRLYMRGGSGANYSATSAAARANLAAKGFIIV